MKDPRQLQQNGIAAAVVRHPSAVAVIVAVHQHEILLGALDECHGDGCLCGPVSARADILTRTGPCSIAFRSSLAGGPGAVDTGQLRQQVEDADKQGDAGEDQAGHGLLHAAPLQKSLQSMDQMAHILSLYLWGYMYIIPIGVCLSRKSAAGFRQNTLRHTDSSCKMTTKQEGENRNATAALPDRRPAHSGPPVR